MAQRHSVDDYLETIWFLAFPIGEYRPVATETPTLASRVAEMLGVSRASAGEMLKRLEADGLVARGEHKEALLTPKGRERAEKVVRKHRIIERLLTDFMGYTAAEAHVHADELGDTFTRRHGRADRGEARPPDALPARLAGRPRARAAREPRADPARDARARRPGDDRQARRARRRAAALVLRPRARPRHGDRGTRRAAGRGPAHRRAERRRARGRRARRRRALRPAG